MSAAPKTKIEEVDVATDSALPEGWAAANIEELSTFITKGTTPTSLGFNYKDRGIPFVRVENLSNGSIDRATIDKFIDDETDDALSRSRLQTGDLLFSIAGTIGRTALVTESDVPANTNQALAIIRGPSNVLSPKYLMFGLCSHLAQQQAESEARGGSMNNISLGDVRAISLPIPPLAEQERIVRQVEELKTLAATSAARLLRISILLKHFRQAVLAAACSGKLTEHWRREHPGVQDASAVVAKSRSELGRAVHDDFDIAMAELDLADIPETWTWAPTAHIGAVRGGIQKQPKRAPKKNAYPYLRVANVSRNSLDLAEIHRMELFGFELQAYKLEPGDLLVVEGNGSLSEIGRSALWTGEIENCVHQNHIIRVRLKGYVPEYVNAYWNSPLGIASIAQVAVTTAGLYSLSTKKIARIPVPVPPIEEQHEIVRRMDTIFKLADAIEKRMAAAMLRAERLTQAILAKAFRGELVPTEAELARREGREYEPASALLERIKAGRAGVEMGNGKKRGRKLKQLKN